VSQFSVSQTAETVGGDQSFTLYPPMGCFTPPMTQNFNGFHSAVLGYRNPGGANPTYVWVEVDCSLTGVDNPDSFGLRLYVDPDNPDDSQMHYSYGSITRSTPGTNTVTASSDSIPATGILIALSDPHTITWVAP
jgi:hypothetical protein